MSYARFGRDSDVYVYFSVSGLLECCGCVLQDYEWVDDPEMPIFKGFLKKVGPDIQCTFDTTDGMIEHLRLHREAGHRVPDIEPALREDDKDNFKKEE